MRQLRLPIATALLCVAALPMLAATALALQSAASAQGLLALWHNSQWMQAAALSLWTGLASTALAYGASAWLLSRAFGGPALERQLRWLPAMLATPHAAFAIGLFFLLSPSGWLLRLASPWLTGFEYPPPWLTTQDPWGLGLIAALTAKEIPFLLWTAATQLRRDDVRQRWQAEHTLAQTLGYGPVRTFWRVVWPQLGPRLRWPLLAVLAYGLTAVEVALVIGPASPPTLAVLAWQWLQDADLATNAQGAAAAGVLALLLALCVALLLGWQALARRGLRRLDGQRGPAAVRPRSTQAVQNLLPALYAAVLLALAVGSVAGVWMFPSVWPQNWSFGAWASVWSSSGTLWTTFNLAFASASLALLWSVAWLEIAPRAWDDALRPVLYLPLVLPSVLWVMGLYALSLRGQLEGRWLGLLLAHSLASLPYVLIALSPAYLGFDRRYAHINASLGHGHWVLLLRIKWPLLRQALASAWAVGFAVSVAQYLPTLYVGAGRYATVTTEAVTLASGAQRSLTSAYAWLQFVLPVLAFALAGWLGRPRRFARIPPTHNHTHTESRHAIAG